MAFETAFTMDTSSIRYGPGVTREVGYEMKRLGASCVMLVVDPHLVESKAVATAHSSLLEAGLERFVRLDKPQDFPGKAALLNEKQQGRKKAFVTMVMEPGEQDAPSADTAWQKRVIESPSSSARW